MKKEELIEKIEGSNYLMSHARAKLILNLIKGLDDDDQDLANVLEDETGLAIVELLVDCYDEKSLLEWLEKQDFNPFNNYRYAEVVRLSDYEDFEDFKENSGAFYRGDPDCLIYHECPDGDIVAVISW